MLVKAGDDWAPVMLGLAAARADALGWLTQSLALMTAKLRAATNALTEFTQFAVLR